jgi:L-asparaginase/Glu-tRNA(Gln) amidotransferase subunit D
VTERIRRETSGLLERLQLSSIYDAHRVIGLTANKEEYDALGMIPADTLNPQKARILLMLALARTSDVDQIRRMFEEY